MLSPARRIAELEALAADLRADRDRWQRLALTDPLTGALNRHGLAEHWRTVHPEHTLAVLDLDGFKQVNDRYGHDAGDAVLVAVAGRLRDYGTVIRLGGDELAVVGWLTAGITPRWPVQLPGGQRITVTAAVGATWIATADRPGTLRRADLAMYRAKRSGVGRLAVFDPAVDVPGPVAGRRRVRDALPATPLARAVATALLQPDLPLTTRDA
ncbi:diguanylate cyclase [Micromonospora sp. NPDC020750]|uniref:diguanylate cyclase n=1 Tax=unclassified Micromonospora TaxID=2617518 RepID=UPI00378B8E49